MRWSLCTTALIAVIHSSPFPRLPRPASDKKWVWRPGNEVTRSANSRPGNEATRPASNKSWAWRPGNEVTRSANSRVWRPGNEVTRPASNKSWVWRPGNEVTCPANSWVWRPGNEVTRSANSWVWRPGNEVTRSANSWVWRPGNEVTRSANSWVWRPGNKVTRSANSWVWRPGNEITRSANSWVWRLGNEATRPASNKSWVWIEAWNEATSSNLVPTPPPVSLLAGRGGLGTRLLYHTAINYLWSTASSLIPRPLHTQLQHSDASAKLFLTFSQFVKYIARVTHQFPDTIYIRTRFLQTQRNKTAVCSSLVILPSFDRPCRLSVEMA